MRDRKFYLDSIKLDLLRVVTATGDMSKPPAIESVKQFLEHSINIFDNFPNETRDIERKKELQKCYYEIDILNDPDNKVRWAERVLTVGCRLY